MGLRRGVIQPRAGMEVKPLKPYTHRLQQTSSAAENSNRPPSSATLRHSNILFSWPRAAEMIQPKARSPGQVGRNTAQVKWKIKKTFRLFKTFPPLEAHPAPPPLLPTAEDAAHWDGQGLTRASHWECSALAFAALEAASKQCRGEGVTASVHWSIQTARGRGRKKKMH